MFVRFRNLANRWSFFLQISVYYPDGSPADNVTVRVRSDVNGYEPIFQEVVSSQGVAKFEIPPLPSVAQSLQLEVEQHLSDLPIS